MNTHCLYTDPKSRRFLTCSQTDLMCFTLLKRFPVLPAAVEPDLSPLWLKNLIFPSQHESATHPAPILLLLCTFMFIIQLIQCRYCNKYHMQTNNGEQTRAIGNQKGLKQEFKRPDLHVCTFQILWVNEHQDWCYWTNFHYCKSWTTMHKQSSTLEKWRWSVCREALAAN